MLAATVQAEENDFQAWSGLAIVGPVKKDDRFLLWFDAHARFRDDASDLGVTILRPGIGWRTSEVLDLWLGYARVVSRSDNASNVEEDRVWQQATYPLGRIAGGDLSGRSRLEQRFRDTDSDLGWRYRQFIRWERPTAAKRLTIVLWNELFLNINDADWGQEDGFNQNRFFLGGALRDFEQGRFEVGYLNNIINTPGSDNQYNHNISASLFFSF